MIFRDARRDEVPRIVALLADDELGAGRETGVDDAYLGAFDDIAADPRSRLIVADVDGQVAGTLQLTVLPGLSRHGMRRAQIEGVRVAYASSAAVYSNLDDTGGPVSNDAIGHPMSIRILRGDRWLDLEVSPIELVE